MPGSRYFLNGARIKLDIVLHTCKPSYVGGTGRRIIVEAGPGKKHEILSEKKSEKGVRNRIF
jgi:hypothetical protein